MGKCERGWELNEATFDAVDTYIGLRRERNSR